MVVRDIHVWKLSKGISATIKRRVTSKSLLGCASDCCAVVDHEVVRCVGIKTLCIRQAESALTVNHSVASLAGDVVDDLSWAP